MPKTEFLPVIIEGLLFSDFVLSVLSGFDEAETEDEEDLSEETSDLSFSVALPLLISLPQSLQYVSPVYPSDFFVAALAFLT